MKLQTGSLIAMAFLVVGLAAGVGILQLKQLVGKPKASVSTGAILFDPTTLTVPPDGTMRVILDPQNNPISFAKVELTFDKNAVLVKEIGYTNLLSMVIATTSATTANNTGVISFTLGLAPADRNNPPATAFDFLTIKFAKKSTTGSQSQLIFNAANSQLVDMASQQMSINSTPANIVVSVPTSSPTPTPSATPLGASPTPTPVTSNTPGEPNGCGGTCGSHSNCKAGFFCFNGYCRNPQCPSQTNCSCVTYTSNPTPSPTPLGARPTPITVNYQLPTLSQSTPTPTPYVYVAPEPSVEPVAYVPSEENVSIWTRIVRFILRLFGIKY